MQLCSVFCEGVPVLLVLELNSFCTDKSRTCIKGMFAGRLKQFFRAEVVGDDDEDGDARQTRF